jgi:hypothetical protein
MNPASIARHVLGRRIPIGTSWSVAFLALVFLFSSMSAPTIPSNRASYSNSSVFGLVASVAQSGPASGVQWPDAIDGGLVISSDETLSSNLSAGSVTIEPGVTLTTEGYSIIVAGAFVNLGTIATGLAPYGPYPISYGGSGGGAQSQNYHPLNGDGTLAPGGVADHVNNGIPAGSGNTPAPGTLNSTVIQMWYSAGISQYLSGAGGGGIAGYFNGGSGGFGLYVQANKIHAGTIMAEGASGSGTCSGIGLSGGGGEARSSWSTEAVVTAAVMLTYRAVPACLVARTITGAAGGVPAIF